MGNQFFKLKVPERKELQTLYDTGLNQKQLGLKYGVGQSLISKWLKDSGIKAHPKINPRNYGEYNKLWKGDNAGYFALHRRLTRKRGSPKVCEQCGLNDANKRYEWASLNKNFANIWDYKRMCVKCHRNFDRKSYLGVFIKGT